VLPADLSIDRRHLLPQLLQLLLLLLLPLHESPPISVIVRSRSARNREIEPYRRPTEAFTSFIALVRSFVNDVLRV